MRQQSDYNLHNLNMDNGYEICMYTIVRIKMIREMSPKDQF